MHNEDGKEGQLSREKHKGSDAEIDEPMEDESKVDDEEIGVVDLEEEEVIQNQTHPWIVLMLVYFLDRPTPRALFENIQEGWRLKEDLDYSYQGENKYLVHYGCETDMSRVMRGGPWQYEFNPLIIEAYDGMKKVSDYKLDSIRIWVRILDIPRNWRTEPVVKALCAKLGQFLQADLDVDGANYVRVGVALPVTKPLERAVAMFAKLKEQKNKVEFEIQYEKLLDFFYTCGYLGHKEKSCGMTLKGGLPNGKYNGKLRCSHIRHYTRQSGTPKAKSNPIAYRSMNFSMESSNSSVCGRGSRGDCQDKKKDAGRQYRKQKAGNPAVDMYLAEQMERMTGGDKDAEQEPPSGKSTQLQQYNR